ncbi:DUF2283 domain-containing protein [Candidatus Woesearchaeota archaeon]|nr:MAG: DUF2283 domain-containing protein [Candidatus Woesearchaeota archaeon]
MTNTKNANYQYDAENDILFIRVQHATYESSCEKDAAVIDYNQHKKIIGIEFFNASTRLHISKESLKNITRGLAKAKVTKHAIHITLTLFSRIGTKEVKTIGTHELTNEELPPQVLAYAL